MKKTKKVALLVLCAALLVGATIAGTMAYLQSRTETVTNTFTVGDVKITLDEQDITTSNAVRVTGNAYNLVPDQQFPKDPTIHVQPHSAASWLFAVVQNDIESVEPASGSGLTIKEQILNKGWQELKGVDAPADMTGATVYWQKSLATDTEAADYIIFEHFDIASSVTGSALEAISSSAITIRGYAIQDAQSLTSAAVAWNAVKGI